MMNRLGLPTKISMSELLKVIVSDGKYYRGMLLLQMPFMDVKLRVVEFAHKR